MDSLFQDILKIPFDPHATYERILEFASKACGTDWANLVIPDGDWLTIYATTGEEPVGTQYQIKGSFSGYYIIDQDQPYAITGDLTAERAAGNYLPLLGSHDSSIKMHSELCVAIKDGDVLIGILNLESPDRNAFDEIHLKKIQESAEILSLALRFARSINTDRIHLATNRILRCLIKEPFSPQEVYGEILKEVLALCNAERGQILLAHPDGLTIHATTGKERIGTHVPLASSFCGYFVVLPGEPYHIAYDLKDPKYKDYYIEYLADDDIEMRSELAVAVVTQSEDYKHILGVINLESPMVGAFTPWHANILSVFARYVSIALLRAADREFETTMAKFMDELAVSDVNLDEWLTSILSFSLELLRAKRGHIMLIKGDKLNVKAVIGDKTTKKGNKLDFKHSVCGAAILERRSIIIPDLQKSNKYRDVYVGDPDTKSELVVPLCHGEIPIGVVNIESPRVNAFSERHKQMLEELATFVNVGQRLKRGEENQIGIFHGFRGRLNLIRLKIEEAKNALPPNISPDVLEDIDMGIRGIIELREVATRVTQKPNLLPISLNQFINNYITKTMYQNQLNLKFESLNGAHDVVIADTGLLADVFTVLLENSIDATKGYSDAIVHFQLNHRADEIDILVEDNGRGIPSDKVHDVFKAGVTTKKSIQSSQLSANDLQNNPIGGSGIGLTEARYLMHRMLGTINLGRTDVDKGTVMRLTLRKVALACILISEKEPDSDTDQPLQINLYTNNQKLMDSFIQITQDQFQQLSLYRLQIDSAYSDHLSVVGKSYVVIIDCYSNPSVGLQLFESLLVTKKAQDHTDASYNVYLERSIPKNYEELIELINNAKRGLHSGYLLQ